MKKPGYLTAYPRHCGISHVALDNIRAGADYTKPFDFDAVDELLDAYRRVLAMTIDAGDLSAIIGMSRMKRTARKPGCTISFKRPNGGEKWHGRNKKR
jgi:hypothetical protein